MSNIPTDLRYANSHEWARANSDGTITIGISDHAQQQLGDLVYVEVPEQGRTVAAAESSATIESVKAASEIYSPVAGEIVEINEQLTDAPELVNNDPYGEGWLFKVKSDDDLNSLMDAESYQQLTASDE